jgi:outer membrane protein OmpA-like peptidoglycan-associated protein
MFFFVMVIFGILSSYLGNQAQTMKAELDQRELVLLALQASLNATLAELSDVEEERIRLEAEILAAEARIEDLWLNFVTEQRRRLVDMRDAQQNFEQIARYRVEMYRKIESMLKEVLGDDVYYDEDVGIVLDTNFLFAVNSHTVAQRDIETINLIKDVLFAIIDEYTGEGSSSLVRFEAFEIRGHTDMSWTGSANRLLAARRAVSIVDLILPDNSVAERDYAQYFLASSASKFMPREGTIYEQTEEQRAANRRVEIIIHFDDREIERAIADIANSLLMTGTVFSDDEQHESDEYPPRIIMGN